MTLKMKYQYVLFSVGISDLNLSCPGISFSTQLTQTTNVEIYEYALICESAFNVFAINHNFPFSFEN